MSIANHTSLRYHGTDCTYDIVRSCGRHQTYYTLARRQIHHCTRLRVRQRSAGMQVACWQFRRLTRSSILRIMTNEGEGVAERPTTDHPARSWDTVSVICIHLSLFHPADIGCVCAAGAVSKVLPRCFPRPPSLSPRSSSNCFSNRCQKSA